MFLSDKMIREAQPKVKPYKLSDGDGLYLCVQPSGSKLWRLKYRFMGAGKHFCHRQILTCLISGGTRRPA